MDWITIIVLQIVGIIISSITLWLAAKITHDELPYFLALIIAAVSGIVRCLPFVGRPFAAVTVLVMLDKLGEIDWFPHGIWLMIVNLFVDICLGVAVFFISGTFIF